MKLIIQIPCFNEEQALPLALRDLPRSLPGIDAVEWLVVNDGSTDGTEAVARANGVDHVVAFTRNQGLAKAFMAGLEASLRLGADIVVTTDADNQYDARDIPALIRPILEHKADLVIGARPITEIKRFPFLKKRLQILGSRVVSMAGRTSVPDATSGFRAMTREAALRFNVFSDYTYTLETIIQAGQKNMAVTTVPIRVNEDLRPSRLVISITDYVKRSIMTILRIFVVYQPFKFFATIGSSSFAAGFIVGLRFLYYYFQNSGGGHIQSLILASILLGVGFQTILVAFLADLMAVNRRLTEDIQYRLRKQELH